MEWKMLRCLQAGSYGVIQGYFRQSLNSNVYTLTYADLLNRWLSQGSPLSPLLFNMICNFRKNINLLGCFLFYYANDYIVIGRSNCVNTTIRLVNNVLRETSEFLYIVCGWRCLLTNEGRFALRITILLIREITS